MKHLQILRKQKGRTILTGNVLPARIGPCSSAASINIILFLLSTTPAFFNSCVMEDPGENIPTVKQIYILKAEKSNYSHADLFFFDDTPPGALDSYTRCEVGQDGLIDGACRNGRKTAVVIVNNPEDDYSWSDICSLEAIKSMEFNLLRDNPQFPSAIGSAKITPGGKSCIRIDTRPVMCRIKLNSLCCDFHGKEYEGEHLSSLRIYLTNIRTSYSVSGGGGGSWMNLGGLDGITAGDPSAGGMFLRDLPVPCGDTTMFPETELFCYPNPSGNDSSFAEPQTRLVIEGYLQGEKYYYPISLGKLEAGDYIKLDVTITSKGTSDPDTPASSAMVRLTFPIRGWDEAARGTVTF